MPLTLFKLGSTRNFGISKKALLNTHRSNCVVYLLNTWSDICYWCMHGGERAFVWNLNWFWGDRNTFAEILLYLNPIRLSSPFIWFARWNVYGECLDFWEAAELLKTSAVYIALSAFKLKSWPASDRCNDRKPPIRPIETKNARVFYWRTANACHDRLGITARNINVAEN